MKGCSLVAGNMVRERKTAEAVEVPPGPSYTQLKLGVNEKGSRVVTKDLPIRAKRMERAELAAALEDQSRCESASKLDPLHTLRAAPCQSAFVVALGVFLVAVAGHAEEVFVRASQVGYRPGDVKIGIAFAKAGLPGSFEVMEAESRKVRFEAKVKPVAGVRWGQFENHAELDFSGFKK